MITIPELEEASEILIFRIGASYSRIGAFYSVCFKEAVHVLPEDVVEDLLKEFKEKPALLPGREALFFCMEICANIKKSKLRKDQGIKIDIRGHHRTWSVVGITLEVEK